MLQENIPLKQFSFYKIGGPASYLLEVNSLQDLQEGLAEWKQVKAVLPPENQKILIIGSATNILFDDRGYNGLIIKCSINTIENLGNNQIKFGAGVSIDEVNEHCINNALSGFEWSGGLPGTVGGAIRGNAGAFGGETKDNVIEVESYNLDTEEICHRTDTECQFNYRSSIFKTTTQNELVLFATFQLQPGDREQVRKLTEEKISYRNERMPLEFPSAGSTFKNVPLEQVPEKWQKEFAGQIKTDPFLVMPVAWLLSQAELKGTTIGGAQIAEKHPNFIINTGGATATDVKELIKLAQARVKEKFDVAIEPEVMILNP